MTIYIQLFKIHPESYEATGNNPLNTYSIERLQITAFDSLGIDLNTPISPMPLPEENADANILVKMEGNSKQVRLAFKFDSNLVSMKVKDGIAEADIQNVNDHIDVDKAGGSTIDYGNDIVATNNLELLSLFLDNFESRSITDSFFFRLVDSASPTSSLFEGVGSIASISTSADSSSPVVWNVNLDFLIGDVVSVYDADTPEMPSNATIIAGASGSGDIVFKWKVPDRSGGTPLTKITLHLQSTDSAQRQSFDITHTTSGSSGTFPLLDSSTGVYTKAVDQGTGNLFIVTGKTYRCFITASNTGGTGTRSEASLVKVQ